MSRRSQRDTNKNKGPNPALLRLKKVREGQASHLELLENKDDDTSLYEELDDQEYLLRRQREVHFIEDDDGSGYVDDGRREEPQQYYSDEEEEENLSVRGKLNQKVNPVQPVKKSEQLHTFFGNKPKLSLKRDKPVTGEIDIENMLSHFDNRIAVLKPTTTTDPTTTGPARKKFAPNRITPIPQVESPVSRLSNLSLEDLPMEEGDNFKVPHPILKVEPPTSQPILTDSQLEDEDDGYEMMDDIPHDILSSIDNMVNPTPTDPSPSTLPALPETESDPVAPWKTIQSDLLLNQTRSDNFQGSIPTIPHDGPLYLYWIDAYVQEKQGAIYLVGKTFDHQQQKYVSCCVAIQSVLRNVYLLPEPPISADADDEIKMAKIQSIIEEINPRWQQHYGDREYNIGLVTRHYAFDTPAHIPAEAEYIKMSYPVTGKVCPFATGLKGQHFSHVFGASTSALELFLIKRKVMGPCWLRIDQANLTSDATKSYCKLEYQVPDTKCIRPVKDEELDTLNLVTPPFTIMSLDIKTVLNSKSHVNEIVSVSCCVFPNVDIEGDTPTESRPIHRMGAIRQLPNTYIPPELKLDLKEQHCDLEITTSEKALLNYLMSRIIYYDPDIFTGHNFLGFGLDVLLTRLNALSVGTWARIGRLRRTTIPKSCLGSGLSASYQQRGLVNGRLICDTYFGAKDTIKSKNYSLTTLSEDLLQIQREDMKFDTLSTYFTTPTLTKHLVQHGFFDAYLVAAIMFKLQLVPLSKQLTILAGSLWNQTMTGARSKRNEYLLLHEFHNLKYLCPDKLPYQEEDDVAKGDELETTTTSSRRKAAYSGGLVLDPKRGLYDSLVLLLDFNSLYPSIIQEFNICFTTVQREPEQETLPEVPDKAIPTGLLPRLLQKLIERRAQVKSLLKDKSITPAKASQLDIRQKALKLTANSMYGCLGYPLSRFYAKPLAMLITAKGRETLQATVDLATNDGLEIVYGDTDSIMINTHTQDLAQAKAVAHTFKKKVNQRYAKLEIDIDGIFQRLLLLQKKKYAALIIQEHGPKPFTTTLEAKGLDLVRREFCALSHTMSKVVLDFVLSGEDREQAVTSIHEYLTEMGDRIRNGEIPLEQFVIYKGLSKSLDKYADAASQPQVQVALRLQKAQGTVLGKGTTVDYIICQAPDDETASKSYAMRAFSLDEIQQANREAERVGEDPKYTVDYDWYFSRQLLPPIGRLCDVIEGTDMARLANCLGLDPGKFRTTTSQDSNATSTLDTLLSNPERFTTVTKPTFPCHKCTTPFTFERFCTVVEGVPQLALACPSCHAPQPGYYLQNHLNLQIRSWIHQFNRRSVICTEPLCHRPNSTITSTTRHPTAGLGRTCLHPNCDGIVKLQLSPHQLYTQLAYLAHQLDPKTITQSLVKENLNQSTAQSFLTQHASLRQSLHQTVDSYLTLSGQRYVHLGQIFKSSF